MRQCAIVREAVFLACAQRDNPGNTRMALLVLNACKACTSMPRTCASTCAMRGNTPAELPRIAQVLAQLRGISLQELADATRANACEALPRLKANASSLKDHA